MLDRVFYSLDLSLHYKICVTAVNLSILSIQYARIISAQKS